MPDTVENNQEASRYNVRRGADVMATSLNTVTSYSARFGSNYIKLYMKGTKNLVVIRKRGLDVVITPVSDKLTIAEAEKLYTAVIRSRELYEFLDEVGITRDGKDIFWDGSTGREVTDESFVEYLPFTLVDQIFVFAYKDADGEESITWPPFVLSKTEDEEGEAIILSAIYASKYLTSPMSRKWDTLPKAVVTVFVANYLSKHISPDVDDLNKLVSRQTFYVPASGPLSRLIPEDAFAKLDDLGKRMYNKHPLAHGKAKLDQQGKAARDAIDAVKRSQNQLPLLEDGMDKRITLSRMMAVGIDHFLKSIDSDIPIPVEIDQVIDPKFKISKMIIWGEGLLAEIKGGMTEALQSALQATLDSENVFIAENLDQFVKEMEVRHVL